ncbi:MAG: AI-2E family transporter [Rhizobiales bacterium]|nr:AI-2E family transporter [Hyphomicrobiales bacterium]
MVASRPGDSDDHRYPTSRTALIGIFILAIIAAVYLARDFLIPVVLAFLIALTFRPAVRKLAYYNVPPWAAATGFASILVLIALVAAYTASGPISGWIADAPEIQRIFLEKIRTVRSWFTGFVHLSEQIQDAATPSNGAEVQEVVIKDSGLSALLAMAAGYPANFVITLSAALVIAIFLMASGDLFYEKLVRVLPTLTDKKTALRIVYDVEREVSSYLLATTAINLGVAVAVAISFQLLGMPTPYLWALLAFVLNFIPYIGPVAGMALSGLASIVIFDSLGYALLAPLAYAAIIGIETQIVSPCVLSRRLRLNSVAILLALAFWAWAWGIAGIIVAVPLLVTFRVFCGHLDALSGIGEFLGESTNGGTEQVEPAAVPDKIS